MYKLLDWIDIDKICWYELSQNPNAIFLLNKRKNNLICCDKLTT